MALPIVATGSHTLHATSSQARGEGQPHASSLPQPHASPKGAKWPWRRPRRAATVPTRSPTLPFPGPALPPHSESHGRDHPPSAIRPAAPGFDRGRGAACLPPRGPARRAGWRPWRNREKEARLAEKYGPTAKQRIESLQEQAKKAKGGSGGDQVTFTRELMRQVLEEHDPRVRCEILQTAADFDTPAAVAICKGALQDPDERVRTTACEVWGERGGAEAVQLLSQRFQTDAELDVRLRALRMLGKLEDKDAIPVLAKALEDPDPAVQYRAVAALKQVSGRDLGNDVNAWRAWAADPAADRNDWSIAEQFRKLF